MKRETGCLVMVCGMGLWACTGDTEESNNMPQYFADASSSAVAGGSSSTGGVSARSHSAGPSSFSGSSHTRTSSGPDVACPDGFSLCNERCVDRRVDPQHCGTCFHACSTNQVCKEGQCVSGGDCRQTPCTGLSYCDLATGQCMPGCIRHDQCSTHEQCNATTHTCDCAPGYHRCNGVCVDSSDVNTCGLFCSPCPVPGNSVATCINQTCGFTCNTGFRDCEGTCAACPGNAVTTTCQGRQCVAARCGDGDLLCNGVCARCPDNPAVEEFACSNSSCVVARCKDNAAECADGCCAWQDSRVMGTGTTSTYDVDADLDIDDSGVPHIAVATPSKAYHATWKGYWDITLMPVNTSSLHLLEHGPVHVGVSSNAGGTWVVWSLGVQGSSYTYSYTSLIMHMEGDGFVRDQDNMGTTWIELNDFSVARTGSRLVMVQAGSDSNGSMVTSLTRPTEDYLYTRLERIESGKTAVTVGPNGRQHAAWRTPSQAIHYGSLVDPSTEPPTEVVAPDNTMWVGSMDIVATRDHVYVAAADSSQARLFTRTGTAWSGEILPAGSESVFLLESASGVDVVTLRDGDNNVVLLSKKSGSWTTRLLRRQDRSKPFLLAGAARDSTGTLHLLMLHSSEVVYGSLAADALR